MKTSYADGSNLLVDERPKTSALVAKKTAPLPTGKRFQINKTDKLKATSRRIQPINYLILGLFILLIVPAILWAGDDSCAVAMSLNNTGPATAWGKADDYAHELYHRFCQAGGEAHCIIYEWSGEARQHQRHAFVVYRDAHGQYWAMDNRHARPCWLVGSTPVEWLKSFAAETGAKIVECASDLKFAGHSPSFDRNGETSRAMAALLTPGLDGQSD